MAAIFFLIVMGVTLLNVILSTALLASSCIPEQFPVLQLGDGDGDRVSGIFLIGASGAARIAS